LTNGFETSNFQSAAFDVFPSTRRFFALRLRDARVSATKPVSSVSSTAATRSNSATFAFSRSTNNRRTGLKLRTFKAPRLTFSRRRGVFLRCVSASRRPGLRDKTGFLGFLDRGDPVEFRNVRVLSLDK